jgi:cyclopropane fatty-acyl-phospholipid synthase-like methyltransferase
VAWYHTYFKGLPQRAWKLHQDEEYTEYEIDFLLDVLEIHADSKVLDVFSGYGRHAIPLATEGVDMSCIDISEEYCHELQSVVNKKKLPIEVICEDVLDFNFEGRQFNAAFCFGNSFSFFPRTDLQRLIQTVADLLIPGGHFAVHTENIAESILPNFQTRNWMPVKEDITYLAENVYNAEGGFIEAEQTFISGSEKKTYSVRQYIYTLADLCAMFGRAGLEVTATFANLEAEPFVLGDEQLYLIAKKV